MYMVREVLNCKPGTVAEMLKKFRAISAEMRRMGREPFRLYTDVSGKPFWTLVAETDVSSIDEFFTMERTLMANETLRAAMGGYHDIIQSGKREFYRVES